MLVVADLHLGFEFSLIESGISLPSQMPKMRDHLLALIDAYSPDTLVFLGDVKHNVPTISLQEWGDVPALFESLRGKVGEIIVVRGNHDGRLGLLLPEGVRVCPSGGMLVDKDVGLFHGHAWPSPKLLGAKFLITAHNHPTVSIRTSFGFLMVERVWLQATLDGKELAAALMRRLSAKAEDDVSTLLRQRYGVSPRREINLTLMPAFNEVLGGVAVNKRPGGLIGPVFRSGVVDVEKADLYLLDGTFLGDVERLRSLA